MTWRCDECGGILKKIFWCWVGHAACMGRVACRVLVDLRERDHVENSYVDGRIILRWIFRKCVVGTRTGLIWLRIETGGGLL